MGINGVKMVWVAVHGSDLFAASNLKGLSVDIGASYSTMKDKSGKGDKFSVSVGDGDDIRVWLVAKLTVRRVVGRGGSVGVGKVGFNVIE